MALRKKKAPSGDGVLDTTDLLTALNTKGKKGKKSRVFQTAAEPSISDIRGVVSTGCFPLDAYLGYPGIPGGIPFGRTTEIFGPESVGKSSLLYAILTNVQQGRGVLYTWARDSTGKFYPKVSEDRLPPGIGVLFDVERRFDKPRAQRIGISLENLVQPEEYETFEDVVARFDQTLKAVTEHPKYADKPIVVGVDTLASAPTDIEIKKGHSQVGGKAKLVREVMRRYTRAIAKRQVAFLVINQVSDRIGVRFGGVESPGGRGVRYHSSYRFKMNRISHLREAGRAIGILSKLQPVKSSVVAPDFEVLVPVLFSTGVDDAMAVFEFLNDDTKFEKPPIDVDRKGWYLLVDPTSGKERKFRASEWFGIYQESEVREWARGKVLEAVKDRIAGKSDADGEEESEE